jgi:predicted esterase
MSTVGGPHASARLHAAGAPLESAKAAMVLLHGRGATAEDILSLGAALRREAVAYLAPQAVGYAWYPQRFIAPVAMNEPHLSSALGVVEACLGLAADAGIPLERTFLLGFSQGACLALEYAARNPARYGGVIALSGGLIGDPAVPRTDVGDLAGTPVFLGCSDVDGHIPLPIVHRSAEVMRRLGGAVDERIYPGMGHTVNDDELDAVRAFVDRALA